MELVGSLQQSWPAAFLGALFFLLGASAAIFPGLRQHCRWRRGPSMGIYGTLAWAGLGLGMIFMAVVPVYFPRAGWPPIILVGAFCNVLIAAIVNMVSRPWAR